MTNHLNHNTYPLSTILTSTLVSLGIYFLGILILVKLSIWLGLAFFFYILFLEVRLLRYSCTHCYYYGKWCAFGRGRLSSLFFPKGDPSTFNKKCITWRTMVPDLLISLVPLLVGIYLLITDFNWLILLAMLIIIGLSSAGNAYVRRSLACKFCNQKELGCPANDLFNKKS